jgi:hypothetical protein
MSDDLDAIGEAVRATCITGIVRLKALGLNRTDNAASREAEKHANAVAGAARVVVSRLPGADQHHRRLVAMQNSAKRTFLFYTMPYGNDEGWRLMPNVNWEPFTKRFVVDKQAFVVARDEFIADLPNVVARARANKGAFNIEVPTEDELRDAYDIDTEFRDISPGRFRGLPEGTSRKLQAHATRRLATAIEAATKDTLSRFLGPLEHFVERMKAYDERVRDLAAGKQEERGRNGAFRDSVVTNLSELVEVVGSFNVLNDERLTWVHEQVQAFKVDPDDLRKDDRLRQDTAQKASNILTNLQEWLQ